MASSAPNPYGAPQASAPAAGAAGEPAELYYSDYNQITASDHHLQQQQQQRARMARQPLMSHSEGLSGALEKQQPPAALCGSPLLLHSSSLAASYDPSYSLGGMASDSELAAPSAAGRHHHSHHSHHGHHHHHRPYSSQSRVYHAHPVPRPAQQPNQAQRSSAHYSTASPAPSSSASSSATGAYLPTTTSSESPVAARPGGRQLPQRPFKQSLSIDHQAAVANQQYALLAAGHSPAHQRHFQEPAGGQKFYANYAAPASRLEMELVEQQAANLSLYEHGQVGAGAELPPVGPARASSASGAGRLDPFQQQQQQKILQQSSQDPYANPARAAFQRAHAGSPDWLPPAAAAAGRPGQFKQTMSIDHYPASRQQQQQQAHYSPARQAHFSAAEPAPFLYGEPAPGLMQAAGREQQHAAPGATAAYYAPSGITQESGQQQQLKYQQQQHFGPGGQQQQQHLEQQAMLAGTNELAKQQFGARAKLQHQASSSSSNSNLSGSLKSAAFEGHANAALNNSHHLAAAAFAQQQQQQQDNSGKQTIGAEHQHHQSKQAHYQQSPQHYGAKPPVAASYHSAQYPPAAGGKQDNLRRGYTSLSSASYGAELGGSQGALSEPGSAGGGGLGEHSLPLSLTHSSQAPGANYGGQLASKRAATMRAASPSLGSAHQRAESQQQQQQSHHAHHAHHAHHHSSSSSHGREAAGGGSASSAGAGGGGAPLPAGMRSESSTGLPNGSTGSAGAGSSGAGAHAAGALTKKSNSATQLSMTGTKKRLGFRKKQVTSFSVHRSEEVAPLEARHLVKQGSSVSEGDSSMSGDSSSRSWSNSNFKAQTSEELASMSFIDGLGKGQMISRQGLASPYLGDIQLSLCDRRGNLEIEVIRARNLQAKTNKVQPLTYVKLYLVKNRKCLGKAKTTLSNKRTLNPLFQQQLTFHEDYHGCILQSIVWGNFGKMDKKNFMGIAQISIDDLELSDTVISWYKLFLPTSIQTLPSKSLRHTLLSNSTESFTTTNNS